jgi:hypothetical protein
MNTPQEVLVVPEKVVAVLLADGWHQVSSGSFTVGPLFGTSVPGFRFEEAGRVNTYGQVTLAGPLDTIRAVRQLTPGAWRRRRPQMVNEAQAG